MSVISQKVINNLLSSQFSLALVFLWLFCAQMVINSPIPNPTPTIFGEAADLGRLGAQGGRSASLGGLDAGRIAKTGSILPTIPEDAVLNLPQLTKSKAVAPGRSGVDPFKMSPGPEVKPNNGLTGEASDLSKSKGVTLEAGKTGVEAGSKLRMGIGNLGYFVKSLKTGLEKLLNRVSRFYTRILISRIRSSAAREFKIGEELSRVQRIEKDAAKSQKLLELKNQHYQKMQEYNLQAGQLSEKLKSITH